MTMSLSTKQAKNFMITLGSGAIHPEFEKGLLGLKAGDSKELEIRFDEKHQNEKLEVARSSK